MQNNKMEKKKVSTELKFMCVLEIDEIIDLWPLDITTTTTTTICVSHSFFPMLQYLHQICFCLLIPCLLRMGRSF